MKRPPPPPQGQRPQKPAPPGRAEISAFVRTLEKLETAKPKGERR